MSVEVVAYDPAWPGMADAAIAEIRAVANVAEIEHIGSTSVPGLAAKPTIDIMAAVEDLASFPELTQLDFHRHENGMTDRLLYARVEDGRRTHILHVVTLQSWPTRNQRFLRDYLRAHPADADRYAALKYAAASAALSAPDYTRRKTELIQELTDKARAELGLPSVPVWEK